MTACLAEVSVKRGGRAAVERALRTSLNAVHFRGLRLASLRGLVAASALVWVQAHGPSIPGLAWVAFLIEASLLVVVATYAAEEHVWLRRTADLPEGSPNASIHVAWTIRDDLRSGLWYGAGASSLLPWISAGLAQPLPHSLLIPLTWLYATLVTSALAIETVQAYPGVRERPSPGHHPAPSIGPQRPGL